MASCKLHIANVSMLSSADSLQQTRPEAQLDLPIVNLIPNCSCQLFSCIVLAIKADKIAFWVNQVHDDGVINQVIFCIICFGEIHPVSFGCIPDLQEAQDNFVTDSVSTSALHISQAQPLLNVMEENAHLIY